MAERFKVIDCKSIEEIHRGFKSLLRYILKLKYLNKTLFYNLISIHGIAKNKAESICIHVGIDPKTLLKDISSKKIDIIYQILNYYNNLNSQDAIHKNLMRFNKTNIERLMKINSIRGRRHKAKLPVSRGSRTRTNANSCKSSFKY